MQLNNAVPPHLPHIPHPHRRPLNLYQTFLQPCVICQNNNNKDHRVSNFVHCYNLELPHLQQILAHVFYQFVTNYSKVLFTIVQETKKKKTRF